MASPQADQIRATQLLYLALLEFTKNLADLDEVLEDLDEAVEHMEGNGGWSTPLGAIGR